MIHARKDYNDRIQDSAVLKVNLPSEFDLIQMEQCADTAEAAYGDLSYEVEALAEYVRQFVALVRSLPR